MNTERRTIIRTAAWSLPVIAAAIAVPAATASTPTAVRKPIKCEREPNHGHGGGVGNRWWIVYYDDGTADVLDNGTVMSNEELRELCR